MQSLISSFFAAVLAVTGPVKRDDGIISVLVQILLGKPRDIGHILAAPETVRADHDPVKLPPGRRAYNPAAHRISFFIDVKCFFFHARHKSLLLSAVPDPSVPSGLILVYTGYPEFDIFILRVVCLSVLSLQALCAACRQYLSNCKWHITAVNC
jgi:hypothetical protein